MSVAKDYEMYLQGKDGDRPMKESTSVESAPDRQVQLAEALVEHFTHFDEARKPKPKKKKPFAKCMECGRGFASVRAAERAMSVGCPGCGGSDIDMA